jgi:uncharacterized membrane protein YciS (DUF1049 family)
MLVAPGQRRLSYYYQTTWLVGWLVGWLVVVIFFCGGDLDVMR